MTLSGPKKIAWRWDAGECQVFCVAERLAFTAGFSVW
jgi:hypothetical protein